MVKAQDMGNYYRVPSDNRDLNYDGYFVEGIVETSAREDYTSHNTDILTIPDIKKLLLKLDYVQNELKSTGNEKNSYNGF
jgi:UDP-glucose 4-epimerase